MSSRNKTADEIADLIERFVSGRNEYFREWNEFVECSMRDSKLNGIRKQCKIISDQFGGSYRNSLDLNRDDRWQDATDQLKEIASQLRGLEKDAAR